MENIPKEKQTGNISSENVDPDISLRLPGKNNNSCFFRKFTGRQRIFLFIFSVAHFFSAAIFALTAPLYPAEAEKKNSTATEYGSVIGIFALTAFFASPVFGKYLFRVGAKTVFAMAMFVGGSATVFFGCLDYVNNHVAFIGASFIIRIVSALGDAAFVTAAFALIASEFPGYVATVFGFIETFFGLGLILGPTLGGLLFQAGGFVTPFATLGGTFIGVSILTLLVLPREKEFKERSFLPLNKLTPGHFAVLKVPRVWLAGFGILACSMTIGFLSATLEPHIRQFNLTPVATGAVFMIYGALYAISLPILGWMCDKVMTPRTVALNGAFFISLGFVLMGPVPFIPVDSMLWLTCVGLALYGVGLGAGMVSSFIMALRAAVGHGFVDNIQTYGVVSSLWNSFFSLGSFIGPSVGGVLLDVVGFQWATVFILGVQTAIIILLITSIWSTPTQPHDKCSGTSESAPLLENTPEDSSQSESTKELAALRSTYGSNTTA